MRSFTQDCVFLIGLTFLAFSTPLLAGGPTFKPPGPNIALGKKYVFNKTTQSSAFEPNYSLTTDDNDTVQLTDGNYTTPSEFWTQKTTVGWTDMPVVSFTIDLEHIEPIRGVSFSTAARAVAGVSFPVAISMFVSDDGQSYYYVGDLVRLSAGRGIPDDMEYNTHRYIADALAAKGRYLRFVIRAGTGGRTFCDEVEVYRGPSSLLEQKRDMKPTAGTDMAAMEAYSAGMVTDSEARKRLRKDLTAMRLRVGASTLGPEAKRVALENLASLAPQIEALPQIQEQGFRAVVPMNDLHAKILRVNASIWRAKGLPPFFIWEKNRWDQLDLFEVPDHVPTATPSIDVAMMNNEDRSAAFNLTNASDVRRAVTVRIEGLPGGPNPDYVSVHQVEFVDTTGKKLIVADPLPLARKTNDGFAVDLPAGMTRQVWFTFHPRGLASGTYRGHVLVQSEPNAHVTKLPFSLQVSALTFPAQPILSLCMWDYANGGRFGAATNSAIADMRSHFLDAPWGTNDVIPSVQPSAVDGQGNLLSPPDFSTFDAWIALWKGKGVRYYLVAFGGSSWKDFAGKPLGTAPFRQGVSQWASAWATHNRRLGLKPGQVAVCIFDEPSEKEHAPRIVEWAKAIKSGTSDILIFEDPVQTAKWYSSAPEMFEVTDILCPNLSSYAIELPRTREIFSSLQKKGKKLWFYDCSGAAVHMDPYYYYRLHAWYAWKYGATGSGFWSYFDSGGTSAWNPYSTTHGSFTPVYISGTDVTDGKHWEAVREGIEDYEYLRMLRDRIAQLQAQGKNSPALTAAQTVLQTVPETVAAGTFVSEQAYDWGTKDRSLADTGRLQILNALERLDNTGTGQILKRSK